MTADLWQRAADAYLEAGAPAEAARCHRAAGRHDTAAGLLAAAGDVREAVTAHLAAGAVDAAAWLLASRAGKPDEARALLDGLEPTLLRRLVLARCEAAFSSVDLGLLAEATAVLADPAAPTDARLESWSVELAVCHRRFDRAALLFAAAVRAGRPGAGERWDRWSRERLGFGVPSLPVVG